TEPQFSSAGDDITPFKVNGDLSTLADQRIPTPTCERPDSDRHESTRTHTHTHTHTHTPRHTSARTGEIVIDMTRTHTHPDTHLQLLADAITHKHTHTHTT